MQRSIILCLAAVLAVVPAAADCGSRGNRQARVEGTITALAASEMDIDTGRRTETLLLTERTRVFRGREEIDASALQPGDRVAAQGARLRSGQLEAREIRIGGRSSGAPSRPGPAAGGHRH